MFSIKFLKIFFYTHILAIWSGVQFVVLHELFSKTPWQGSCSGSEAIGLAVFIISTLIFSSMVVVMEKGKKRPDALWHWFPSE